MMTEQYRKERELRRMFQDLKFRKIRNEGYRYPYGITAETILRELEVEEDQ